VNVLLVTGSRSLSKQRRTEKAVEAILRRFEYRIDLLVAGDANGPDRWALRHAHSFDCGYERWTLSGFVQCEGESWEWSQIRLNDPLVRNRCMVGHVRDKYLDHGENVLCVGFVDPESKTHGTDHTLRLARQAGIWCARYVWRGEQFEEKS
jgi:hypothetical protein